MTNIKFDGVIEAVNYNNNGQVNWVRAYLRRGPTWSDRNILKRAELLEQIKAGKRFVAGKRVPQLAGTFEIGRQIRLVENQGNQILTIDDNPTDGDCLEGVPLV
jgi:hypothetical protein